MADPDQGGRFNYGPQAAVTERKNARRRSGRRDTPVDVATMANSNQDDRFSYGPQTAVAKANRRRARDAMARGSVGTTSARHRDDGSSDSPQFTQTMSFGGGWSDIVSEARRYIGTNPTSRRSLWCARFMNLVLERSGYKGTGSDMARSFARYGRRVSGPQVGAIAVMSRGRSGGHVGVVSGVDESGNPIIISGNVRNQVSEIAFPRGVIYAYVMPTQ